MRDKLIKIQQELKVPKNRFNKFGGYNYRSCEDIVDAVKPLCEKYNCLLTLSDCIENIGDRNYVKASALLTDETGSVEVTAYAREDESVKGMSAAQVTGSTSSYARKYALNGLFAIDDVQDADATNTHGKDIKSVAKDIQLGGEEDDLDL